MATKTIVALNRISIELFKLCGSYRVNDGYWKSDWCLLEQKLKRQLHVHMLRYYTYFLVQSSLITTWLNNTNDTYQALRRSPEYPSGKRLFPTLVIFCEKMSFILNGNSILYSDAQHCQFIR
jgi:hypothetical protein